MKLLAKSRGARAAGVRRRNGTSHGSAAGLDRSSITVAPSSPSSDIGARLGETRPRDPAEALSVDIAADLAPLFKLLADETRLRIVQYLLQQKEIHVRAFCERLGQSQPAVSHHLALLREAGLIDVRREGKHNFYHLLPAGFGRFLDMLFSSAGPQERRIRFEQYVLSYAPASVDE
ncbi:MAG TPA: metalloregulator ArsR/SmtB family transcription factor [Pirellulales bacterium]